MTEPAAGDKPARPFPVLSVVFFAVAFTLRFVAARLFAGEPVWDGHYYDFGARRIAEGHGYSDDRIVDGITEWHPWCHYPVGYSAFLGFFYKIFGEAAWVAHFANALTGALVVVVVYELARETFTSPRRQLAAGIIAAVHPGMVLYGALVMGEMLAALTVMLAFLVAIRVRRVLADRVTAAAPHESVGDPAERLRPSRLDRLVARIGPGTVAVGAGALVLGVGALVRPQALLCAPFLAFAVPGSLRARVLPALVACIFSLLPVLPWSARNCAVMDGCALVSTNAGWNLAIGAFPRATGRFETLRSSDGCREVTGQVQQDRCWLHYGIDNIAATPGRWLSLIPAKLSYTFDHESFQVEYLHEARPDAWPEDRRARGRQLLTLFHRLLVAVMPLAFLARSLLRVQMALIAVAAGGAILGLSADTPTVWPLVIVACALQGLPLPARPEWRPALAMCVVLIASTVVTHAIFFGEDRYHIVCSPALCLLAAAVLRVPSRATRRIVTS